MECLLVLCKCSGLDFDREVGSLVANLDNVLPNQRMDFLVVLVDVNASSADTNVHFFFVFVLQV